MPVIPDFGSLDSAAAKLRQHADDLRQRAVLLGGVVASARWAATAADAFRHRSDILCRQLRQCADGLDHAAQVLEQHAATARHHLTATVAVLEATVGTVVDATHAVGSTLSSGERSIASAIHWAGF
jgi:uncharacterized protein YukE